MLLGLVVE
ncbi:hypothetical protein LINPERPRIM_LOCUS20273 [Linum perenne]